jgi:hypothetical protein
VKKGKHCVEVSQVQWRSIKAFERDGRSKILWKDLGSRCFTTKTAAIRYAKKVTTFRPGRAKIIADITTIPAREWAKK